MKQNTKQTLKYFWQASSRYKISVFFIFVSVVGGSLAGMITPLFFREFFNVLAAGLDKVLAVKQLVKILIFIAGVSLVEWAFWRVSGFITVHFQSRVIADLNNQCFEYLHKHSYSFFNNSFVGSLVKRVKWFGKAFEHIADKICWNILPLTVSIVVATWILLKRNIWLGLGILAWTAVFLILNWLFARYKLKYDIERASKETETTAVLADTITNNANVTLFGGYQREVKLYRQVMEAWRKITKFSWNLSTWFEALQGLLVSAFEIGVFYAAIVLWQRNVLTLGDFILVQAYLITIFNRVWDFGKVVRTIYESLADAEEMTVILQTPHEIQDIPKAKKLVVCEGRIEFKNVDFYYHQTRMVLRNFNFVVLGKEKVALIGPSGAGKSTVAKLVLRLHDVSAGEILIDGQNIAKVAQESLRQNIAFVPQDPILFHRTLMENIRYGRPQAVDQEVIKASKIAHCHEFIRDLPQRYATFVGERGIKLSGGERQRVAIARAVLKNSPVLILDEATSSLDSASEKLIQEAITELMKNKTVVIIAHRLSTIRKMDRIVVIDNGGITEQGTHHQLARIKEGQYRKLWELQAGGFK
ncbi:MAG: ABC transporter ATP-binding protein/permease [Patescibacteria group bacterium]|nr:ABC transporter ATP-binding protein/permease [Patescibacteria group bacterium]